MGLFETSAEREKRRKKEARRKLRAAERSRDQIQRQITEAKKAKDVAWTEAKRYRKEGQKVATDRALKVFLENEQAVSKLEHRRFMIQRHISAAKLAQTDQELARSVKALYDVLDADPDDIIDSWEEAGEKRGEHAELDVEMQRLHDEELEKMGVETGDAFPSLEELTKALDDEVVAEMDGEAAARTNASSTKRGQSLRESIQQGRDRLSKLRKLLEDDR